jgi:hypothetical protein
VRDGVGQCEHGRAFKWLAGLMKTSIEIRFDFMFDIEGLSREGIAKFCEAPWVNGSEAPISVA